MSPEKSTRNKPGPKPSKPPAGTSAYEINTAWLKSGKKLEEMIGLTGIKRASLSSYLSGKRSPSDEEDVKKIGEALGEDFLPLWRDEKSNQVERRGGARKAGQKRRRSADGIENAQILISDICIELELLLPQPDLQAKLSNWIDELRHKWKINLMHGDVKDVKPLPPDIGLAIPDMPTTFERPPRKTPQRKRGSK